MVPVRFACDEAAIWFVADAKPKRGPASALPRLRTLRENPRAALVVDDRDEDWGRLARVPARGRGRAVADPGEHAAALVGLRDRYPRYRATPLDDPAARPVVRLVPARVRAWRADPRVPLVPWFVRACVTGERPRSLARHTRAPTSSGDARGRPARACRRLAIP